ncbi:MAG: hypothetical protein K0U78_19165, partial [Actinomycetia bacterium]|nr:hypothetical protein [Actinomycetes bacterium]
MRLRAVANSSESTLVASPRYRVHPVSESGWFDPFSVDAAGYRGVGAPAGCRVLGWGSVAQ